MLETDFRANRADETPRLQEFNDNFLTDVSGYYVGTLADAMGRYAEALGQPPISVGDLIKLHDDNQPDVSDVRFDVEF